MAGLLDSSDAVPATSRKGYPLLHDILYNSLITWIKKVGAKGLEPVKDLSRNTHVSLLSGNKCGAYLNDANLEVVVSAWAKLPNALKAGIVAMVRSASDT